MTKGVLLFAFNSDNCNYYSMAEYTAKRINYFLNLPVTLITNEESLPEVPNYNFDHIILADADNTNKREFGLWLNKGRYRAYDLTPYDETLLLDTDYMVNSTQLLKLFDIDNDFMCHSDTEFLTYLDAPQEIISSRSFQTLWATVVKFNKTNRVNQIFQCLEMVQNNYEFYSNLYDFVPMPYRNDYALTIALRIVNGHMIPKEDIIPWKLTHIANNIKLYKNNESETEYTIIYEKQFKGRSKTEYMIVKDKDFHVMNKQTFMRLMYE